MTFLTKGSNRPFENRPINIRRFDKKNYRDILFLLTNIRIIIMFMVLMILTIIFLNLLSTKFIPKRVKTYLKSTFSIIKFQPSTEDDFFKSTNTRVWSTDLYSYVYFHDFVKQNIQQDIK